MHVFLIEIHTYTCIYWHTSLPSRCQYMHVWTGYTCIYCFSQGKILLIERHIRTYKYIYDHVRIIYSKTVYDTYSVVYLQYMYVYTEHIHQYTSIGILQYMLNYTYIYCYAGSLMHENGVNGARMAWTSHTESSSSTNSQRPFSKAPSTAGGLAIIILCVPPSQPSKQHSGWPGHWSGTCPIASGCSLTGNPLSSQLAGRPPGGPISKLGGKVMEVMEVIAWEVMNSCSNGSNEEVIGLQNDHEVMKMAHGVMM